MSNIGFSSNDIFLGLTELQKFQSFIQDVGYQKFIRENTIKFGLINNSIAGNFDNAKIIEGTADNTIKHDDILAIDVDGRFIIKEASGDIIVPGSGDVYWVKLVRSESNLEVGTINISTDGTLSGVGTSFLTLLRGVTSDFPTKIKFPNSVGNSGEYDILSVTNDNTAALNVVSMTAESDQEWQILPTSTPGAVLTNDEKKLFNYDSATISLVLESALTLVDGLPEAASGEYWLARVQNSGTSVIIQDKRSNYVLKTVDGYFTSNLDKSANPLIGVEASKFKSTTDPRNNNIVELAFGMRSSNWTSDSNANRITIVGGNGGKFKSTSDFTNGDFDGWRIYFKSGKYSIIKQSNVFATQINLIIDSLDVAELADTSQQLLIVPDCSEVEVFFAPVLASPLSVIKRVFPINTDICRIEIPIVDTTTDYIVTYRHKHINNYGAFLVIPNDAVGYYDESSFNEDGSLKSLEIDRNQVPYTSGTITLVQAVDAYLPRISSFSSDKFGVTTTVLNASTVNNQLTVGTDNKEQIYTGTVTLTINKYINLRTSGAVAGNQFFLKFEAVVDKNGNEFQIVQEWLGTGTPGVTSGTVLFDFNTFYLTQSTNDNLLLRCTFNGTNWIINILDAEQSVQYIDAASSVSYKKVVTRIFETGPWNMDASSNISVTHNISDLNQRVLSISTRIRLDISDGYIYDLVTASSSGVTGAIILSGTIDLFRSTSGFFDSVSFDDAVINRGLVYVTYFE